MDIALCSLISAGVCAGADFVVQYLTRRHLLSLCEVSQISEPVSRAAHTRTLKGEAPCAASLAGVNKSRERAPQIQPQPTFELLLFVQRRTRIAKPHLPFLCICVKF